MKESLGMTPAEVISQNLKVSFISIIGVSAAMYLVSKYHPLKLAKISAIFAAIVLLFVPYWFDNISSLVSLTLLQLLITSFSFTVVSACLQTYCISKKIYNLGCNIWYLKRCDIQHDTVSSSIFR